MSAISSWVAKPVVKTTIERAVKTFCQTALALLATSAALSQVNWVMVLDTAVFALVLSILTSVASSINLTVNVDTDTLTKTALEEGAEITDNSVEAYGDSEFDPATESEGIPNSNLPEYRPVPDTSMAATGDESEG
jgi:hypothetical protein